MFCLSPLSEHCVLPKLTWLFSIIRWGFLGLMRVSATGFERNRWKIMCPAEIVPEVPGSLLGQSMASKFSHLRGVRWRIELGVLPSSPASTIDDLRRVSADSRRRYSLLRLQLNFFWRFSCCLLRVVAIALVVISSGIIVVC